MLLCVDGISSSGFKELVVLQEIKQVKERLETADPGVAKPLLRGMGIENKRDRRLDIHSAENIRDDIAGSMAWLTRTERKHHRRWYHCTSWRNILCVQRTRHASDRLRELLYTYEVTKSACARNTSKSITVVYATKYGEASLT